MMSIYLDILWNCVNLNNSLNESKNMLIMPKRENPVSSAHIPNVPPKLAILSDNVYLASSTVIPTLDD